MIVSTLMSRRSIHSRTSMSRILSAGLMTSSVNSSGVSNATFSVAFVTTATQLYSRAIQLESHTYQLGPLVGGLTRISLVTPLSLRLLPHSHRSTRFSGERFVLLIARAGWMVVLPSTRIGTWAIMNWSLTVVSHRTTLI